MESVIDYGMLEAPTLHLANLEKLYGLLPPTLLLFLLELQYWSIILCIYKDMVVKIRNTFRFLCSRPNYLPIRCFMDIDIFRVKRLVVFHHGGDDVYEFILHIIQCHLFLLTTINKTVVVVLNKWAKSD